MKKSILIPIVTGVLISGVCATLYVLTPKSKIDVKIEDNTLLWVNRANDIGSDCLYEIYNDEFKIASLNGNGYVLADTDLIDIDGPSKIKNVVLSYGKDSIDILWGDAEDVGTKNTFTVLMVDGNGKSKYISNKDEIVYSSGISRYIIKNNGVNIDSINTKFPVQRNSLQPGINYISIIAQDKRGNLGKEAKIPIYNYPIIISFDGETVGYHIDDRSQSYDLVAYVNGEKLELGNNISKLNEYIKDVNAPTNVKDIKIQVNDKSVKFNLSPVKEVEQKYNISIQGTGLTYKNVSYSDEIEVVTTSGVKGFYYQINTVEDYTVTDNDSFINNLELKKDLEYGTYYIHVASVDNAGNISNTYTKKFEVSIPVVEDDIKDSIIINDSSNNSSSENINSSVEIGNGNNQNNQNNNENNQDMQVGFVYGRDNTSKAMITKAVNLINNLPYNVLNKLNNSGLKVYITGGSAEQAYNEMTGNVIGGITGIFYYTGNVKNIIVEDAYISTVLYHEIGHAIDYIYGNGSFISDRAGFKEVYEEEKNNLFSINSVDASSSKEYFAECFNLYMQDIDRLKLYAPKTLEYIESIIE